MKKTPQWNFPSIHWADGIAQLPTMKSPRAVGWDVGSFVHGKFLYAINDTQVKHKYTPWTTNMSSWKNHQAKTGGNTYFPKTDMTSWKNNHEWRSPIKNRGFSSNQHVTVVFWSQCKHLKHVCWRDWQTFLVGSLFSGGDLLLVLGRVKVWPSRKITHSLKD